jgi:hypothetical protein
MNTWTQYVVGSSCILKGGDRADQRMTELNELIASAKRTAATRAIALSCKRNHEPANLPKAALRH